MPDPSSPTGPALFDLTGRRALVTGSTQGLGLSLARGLVQAGASVVINGRSAAKVDPVVGELNAAGFDAVPLVMDVTDDANVAESLATFQKEVGPIDILVNNVGIQDRAPLAEMTPEAFRKVIDVNLTSAFVVTRQIAPGMIERGAGKVINVCSLMSDLGRPTTGNYAAAKGGLRMLTRAMAVEWAEHNLQINAIGPGYFATELTRPLVEDEKFNSWICGRTPAGRWGRPEELIGAAVYFASPASSFVNGQILYIDGGLTAAI